MCTRRVIPCDKLCSLGKLVIDGNVAAAFTDGQVLWGQNKVTKAINLIKNNENKSNSNFFEAYILLISDSIIKKDFKKAKVHLKKITNFSKTDRFNTAILESLIQYINVFEEKKILNSNKDLGKLSTISETFQRCYLEDPKTDEILLTYKGALKKSLLRVFM